MVTNPRIPAEITHTRAWLHDLFREAGRGLPLPHQLALIGVEHAIAMGMFGGLMVSAWALAETRRGPTDDGRSQEFQETLSALEEAALGPIPAQLGAAIRQLGAMPGGPQVLDQLAKGLGPVWEQLLDATKPRNQDPR